MKILIIGYGRMGRMVEQAALQQGHQIVMTIDNEEEWKVKAPSAGNIDVAIEFSEPAVAMRNFERCLDLGIPLVTGTTGWYEHIAELRERTLRSGGSFLFASNFNIGVNLFFELNRRLAAMTDQHHQYMPRIAETHHIHKLDKPSGTAATLARDIIERRSDLSDLVVDEEATDGQLPIRSIREGEVMGIHEVTYQGPFDEITLRHEAHDRMGFALGALFAAEWLQGRKGFFEFREVIFGEHGQSGT